jgi:predicted lipoprotein with Yx(FWY)xxD motif
MTTISLRRFALGLVVGAFAAAALAAANAYARPAPSDGGQPVIDWNRVLLGLVSTPGVQPASVQPTRNFAIVQTAIYDAVNSIDRTHEPYLIEVHPRRGASETAAADAAAYRALLGLYPSQQQTLDATYAAELAEVPAGPARDEGVRIGAEVAHDLLAVRADDGSQTAPPPFNVGTDPGAYRPTPPNLAAPVFTGWGQVKPFALDAANQFRPAPPYALTTDAYARALQEVQSLGAANSTTRTPEQTQIATFWNPPIQNAWNQIAETVAAAHHSDLPTTARLFAALDVSFADGAIAFYDAKYTFQLWRPVTAINLADTDGNPNTTADAAWLPLTGTTPADPSYPGAHSTISAAGADVLARFYGDAQRFTVTSPALPGVTRSFRSFSAAAEEAGLSRIYAGVHTRLDHVAGLKIGYDVATFVLGHALLPNRGATLTAARIPARQSANTGTVVDVARSRFGRVLVDEHGRTLYDFPPDKGTMSVCYGACAALWPPLTTKAKPHAGPGVRHSLLGTTRRSDGTLEVTYGGHPLYYYVADRKRGQFSGQGLDQFGAPWWVISPTGTEIHRG